MYIAIYKLKTNQKHLRSHVQLWWRCLGTFKILGLRIMQNQRKIKENTEWNDSLYEDAVLQEKRVWGGREQRWGKRLITDPSNYVKGKVYMTVFFSEIIWIVESHYKQLWGVTWLLNEIIWTTCLNTEFLIGSQSKLNITACWLCSRWAIQPPILLSTNRQRQTKRDSLCLYANDRNLKHKGGAFLDARRKEE